jgi:hypothetical protein
MTTPHRIFVADADSPVLIYVSSGDEVVRIQSGDSDDPVQVDCSSEDETTRITVENADSIPQINVTSVEDVRIFAEDADSQVVIEVNGGNVVINEQGELIEVIKNFPKTGVSGSQNIDVSTYASKFRINDISFTLLTGVGGVNKVGLTAGGSDVIMETDMSDLVINNPVSIYCGKMFGPGQTHVYFFLAGVGASYNIDLTLIRYKQ